MIVAWFSVAFQRTVTSLQFFESLGVSGLKRSSRAETWRLTREPRTSELLEGRIEKVLLEILGYDVAAFVRTDAFAMV